MIPITPWTNQDPDERAMRERLELRRHGDELPPLPRDGRWAAAIHRWAQRDAMERDAARLASEARRPSPSW